MLINNTESFPSSMDKSSDDMLKNFPFSYYNSQLFGEHQESLGKKMESLCLEEKSSSLDLIVVAGASDKSEGGEGVGTAGGDLKGTLKPKSLNSQNSRNIQKEVSNENEIPLKDKIESQIKSKYNLIIPAILIEVQESGQNKVQLEKEDMKNLLTSLGTVKHIEINKSIAYVLYEHYFSALLAYNILKELTQREKKNMITIKLFTKEEDEEKQKKVYNQQKEKESVKEKKRGITGMGGKNNSEKTKGVINVQTPSNHEESKKSVSSLKKESKPFFSQEASSMLSGIPEVSESSFFTNTSVNLGSSFFQDSRMMNSTFNPLFLPFHMTVGPLPTYQFPPSTSNSANQNYLLKFVCNYDIQIENESKFRVTKRLIGNKGLTLKKILFDCCVKFNDFTTKIRLRGKGSGYKEGLNKEESTDPLTLCVSSLNYFTYSKCCEQVEKFLKQIYMEYFNFLFSSNLLMEATPKNIVKYEYVVNRF